MDKTFEYIFEDLAAIKRQQVQQKRFNRRIVIFSLLAIVAAEFYTFNLKHEYEQLSAELKEYKQSKEE